MKYPGATQRPISCNFTNRKRTATRGIVLHVDAGNAATLAGWFNNPSAQASSHLYVKRNGDVEQYVDLDKIAWTTGAANDTTIGIETQGYGDGEWTPQQLRELAILVRWAAWTYKFPLKKMRSSKAGAKGVGTHRLGVDGNFPANGVQRGREQRGGGELWSKSRGKTCPGDKRQARWGQVVRLAQKHRLAKKTVGHKGVAFYKSRKVGKKNITRVLPLGREVHINKKKGRWGRTVKGDWVKFSKVREVMK